MKAKPSREPDAVDLIFEKLLEEFPEMAATLAAHKAAVRAEFGGQRVYARRTDNVSEQIIERFNGANVRELAAELSVSRGWVYRVLRKARGSTGGGRPA